jgi:hypothetical protein
MAKSNGHFAQKGWGLTRVGPENRDRSRWYGIRPGDMVSYNVQGAVETGYTVMRLHELDNNGCTIKKGTREFKIACEWLKIERAVDAD